ncbi:hypothetical protein [Pseudarthrobacter cellobiosi]|uniref:hypothetical protein n=1 Tax=Pseudarthrobacter cellobiosi TaxID=2953654 RepID=UPI00208ED26B|nr:hypothetical protein [Pseudarthrobacter sp. HLT1-5]MCO4253843.1 hypothetical protein [Pseudarthrobacter sp. HLT1-5]
MNQHVEPNPRISSATRRQLLAGAAAFAVSGLAAATATPGYAAQLAASTASGGASPLSRPRNKEGIDRKIINRWAHDTWQSLVAMTDPATGLPADYIGESITAPKRSGFTSPTNIGGYMWSTVVARELNIISANECPAADAYAHHVGRTQASRTQRHALQLVRRSHG